MTGQLDRSLTRSWCEAIDGGPYSTLAVGERVTFPNFEMFATLALAAAWTDQVQLMASVAVLPMHAVADVAQTVGTLDVASGGRMVLGVGVGGRHQDFAAMERPFTRRHARLDEQVLELRALWAGESAGAERDAGPVGPAPFRNRSIEVLAAAMGPKSLARAARWADGLAGFVLDPLGDDPAHQAERAVRAWSDAGRPQPRLVTSFWYSVAPDGVDQLHTYAARYLGVFGDDVAQALARSTTVTDSDRLEAALDRCAAAGYDEVILVPTSVELDELDSATQLVQRWS